MKKIFFPFLFFCFLNSLLHAQGHFHWTGQSSSNWQDDENWISLMALYRTSYFPAEADRFLVNNIPSHTFASIEIEESAHYTFSNVVGGSVGLTTDDIGPNIIIGRNASLTIEVAPGTHFNFDLLNNVEIREGGTFRISDGSEGTMEINFANQANSQSILFQSFGTCTLGTLRISNPVNVDINQNITVRNELIFDAGKITTPTIFLPETCNILLNNTSSFIDGRITMELPNIMRPTIFPTGDGNQKGYLYVTPDGENTTYTVQYFHESSPGLANVESPLENVSSIEHWIIGSPTLSAAIVGLTYNTHSMISHYEDLRVALYNSNKWVELQTNANGNNTEGTLSAFLGPPENFNANQFITLGSIDKVTNPLPINFKSFYGEVTNHSATLFWESNTDETSFDIERSADGINFKNIGSKQAEELEKLTGKYSFVDSNVNPVNFYRIRLTDNYGNSRLSNIIKLSHYSRSELLIQPNPGTGNFRLISDSRFSHFNLELVNAQGQISGSFKGSLLEIQNELNTVLEKSTSGLYYLKGLVDGENKTIRIIKE